MTDSTTRSPVVRPHWGWFALLDGGLAALLSVSLSGRAYEGVGAIGLRLPPPRLLRHLLIGAVVVHVVEAMAAARDARRRGLPVRGWTLQTLIVGFPSLLTLRRTRRN
jgi:hypothetical protein